MQTLQWTCWWGCSRHGGLRVVVETQASYASVAPRVEADWEGEAVVLQGDALEVTVKVRQEGKIHIWLEGPDGGVLEVHQGELTTGVHAWSLTRPVLSGAWLAKLSCQGHRTERRFHVA